jgi:hypothetical protein
MNPFDQFDAQPSPQPNPFDQFDAQAPAPTQPAAPVVQEPSFLDKAKDVLQNATAGDYKAGGMDALRFLVHAGNGLFGASDEIGAGVRSGAAALNAAVTGQPVGQAYSNEYDSSLKNIRQVSKDFETARAGDSWYNPTQWGPASVGLIATAPLAAYGVAAKGAPWYAQSLAGARVAAPIGGVTGFMSGEDGIGNRLKLGAEDAVAYGSMAAASPPAVTVAGKVGGLVWNGVSYVPKLLAGIAEDHLFPEHAALRQVGQVLGNDAAGGMPVQDVIDAVKATGMSPAEVGGSNLEAYADNLAQQPGPARPYMANMLEQKVANQAEAIPQMVKDQLGSTGEGTNAIDLAAQRKAIVQPLAEKAFADVPGLAEDPHIQQLLQNPRVQSGLQTGLEYARSEADMSGVPFTPPKLDTPSMQMLDMAKRGLDAQITAGTDAITGALSPDARIAQGLKTALVSKMKAASPDYANYLKTAADQFSLQDAAKLGRSLWNSTNKEEMVTRLSGLSDPEKTMALNGAVRGLVEQMERKPDNANIALTQLRKPYYRDLLRPLVPEDGSLDNLVENLSQQAQAFQRNQQWLSQSKTALRGQFGDKPTDFSGILKTIQGKILNSDTVRDRAAQMILDQNPQTSVPMLHRAAQFAPKPPTNFVNNPAPGPGEPMNFQRFLAPFYMGARTSNTNQGE